MRGSPILVILFHQLFGLTLMALASPFPNATTSLANATTSLANASSTVSGDTISYCQEFIYSVNPYQGPYWEGMNASLSAYCLISWCNALNTITPYETVIEEPVYPPKYVPPVTTTITNATISTATITSPASTPATLISYSSYPSFMPPCCGQCSLTIESGAQVLYWPTPAPEPPVSSIVDANGFTFVSPSVYVIFSSLSAADNCGAVGSLQPNFTTSFAPNELSTLSGDIRSPTLLTLPFDFADLNDCFTSFVTVTYSKEFDTTEVFTTVEPDWMTPSNYNLWESESSRCYPRIVVGTWMTQLDPAWSSCTVVSNYVGSGPIISVQPLPLADSITTASSSMTTSLAAPSSAPQSIAAMTSTAEAYVAASSGQAGAN